MKIYLYNEHNDEIIEHNFTDKISKSFDILLVKDESLGSISLKVFDDYIVKFSKKEWDYIFSIVDKKDILDNKIKIYTPYLLLKFLEYKLEKNCILKLGDNILFLENDILINKAALYLIDKQKLSYIQFENKIIELE